jgi:hypothetical protein
MMQATDSSNPMFPLLYSQMMQTMDGEGSDTVRKVARLQELQFLMSVSPALIEPKDEIEEQFIMQMIQQAQQPQQPDPNMVLAEAELLKGQASVLKAQNDQANTQIKAIDTQASSTLKEAQTIKTIEEAKEISQKGTRESIKLVTDIRGNQQKSAIELSKALRG